MTDQIQFMVPALLQPAPLQLTTDMVRFTVIVGLFVLFIILAMVFVFRSLKPGTDARASGRLREEFDKSKDTLLLAVQAKKATRESEEGAERRRDADEQERELLLENVDTALVIGKACPLSGLEMMEDQELIIDPYTGQGYHYSSFIMDWPRGTERPKYVYRYPQGTIVRTDHVISDF